MVGVGVLHFLFHSTLVSPCAYSNDKHASLPLLKSVAGVRYWGRRMKGWGLRDGRIRIARESWIAREEKVTERLDEKVTDRLDSDGELEGRVHERAFSSHRHRVGGMKSQTGG